MFPFVFMFSSNSDEIWLLMKHLDVFLTNCYFLFVLFFLAMFVYNECQYFRIRNQTWEVLNTNKRYWEITIHVINIFNLLWWYMLELIKRIGARRFQVNQGLKKILLPAYNNVLVWCYLLSKTVTNKMLEQCACK